MAVKHANKTHSSRDHYLFSFVHVLCVTAGWGDVNLMFCVSGCERCATWEVGKFNNKNNPGTIQCTDC
jgi:hypothetical protein